MHTHADATDVSRHKCLIYDGSPSQQLPVVVPLLMDGLQGNWRCLYFGSPDMVGMINTALGARGVDTRRESSRGALLLSSDRSHLDGGTFYPERMIGVLRTQIDEAVAQGFEGLCATGDMKWELGTSRNFDRLIEYEALLEQVFHEKPLRGICQYHRDLVPAQAVRDALITHRSAYIGDVLNEDNLYYIPPDLLLETCDTSKQGEWMCQQIIRVLNAEQKRDKALTDLRRSEAHQRALAGQLAEMNRDLENRVRERTAELEVANGHLEAFSYSVSHDLRAPLRSISGFGNALAEECGEALGEEGGKCLARLLGNAHHMEDLIEGLLTLGRVVKTELHRVRVDLGVLAENIAEELRQSETARSVELVVGGEMRAMGDPILIRAMLTNLLGNAWKFTAKKPKARIEVGTAGSEGDQTVFFVRDNGAGFDMKYAEKLFGAFQRLHRQDEFPGTGVGLATVQRIINRHGGKIWAEGQPEHGATFFFTLPS